SDRGACAEESGGGMLGGRRGAGAGQGTRCRTSGRPGRGPGAVELPSTCASANPLAIISGSMVPLAAEYSVYTFSCTGSRSAGSSARQHSWNVDREPRAAADLGLERDGATQYVTEPSDDREPEARSGRRLRNGIRGLIERLEDAVGVRPRDPRTCIDHGDAETIRLA